MIENLATYEFSVEGASSEAVAQTIADPKTWVTLMGMPKETVPDMLRKRLEAVKGVTSPYVFMILCPSLDLGRTLSRAPLPHWTSLCPKGFALFLASITLLRSRFVA